MEIQTQTMKYIGREIHDNVGQKLTLSSLYLQQLLLENKTTKLNKNLNTINGIINESLNELRQLSKSLTDDHIKDHSIIELIEEECKRMRELKVFVITFNHESQIAPISYQIKSVLLRIVQEFLQNSMKHSKCKHVDIMLTNKNNEIHLSLKDNGIGFDIATIKTDGIGLKNMSKRIEMNNGLFNLVSTKKGTQIDVKIPV